MHFPALLGKIHREQLSDLFDETLRYWDICLSGSAPTPPDDATLRGTVEKFMASLSV